MTQRLAPVLDASDLPLAELHAARLDGELFSIGEGFAPVDELEQARLRALSLGSLTRGRLIVERASAAWVHGVLFAPPSVHTLCIRHTERTASERSVRFTLREVVIADSELMFVRGQRVTTPVRTIIDLLRQADLDQLEVSAVARYFAEGLATPEQCRAALDARHKLASKRRALKRLEEFELHTEGGALRR